ncbi:MAG: TetR/AcrR family transcriptional regulator [Candidatus Cloacimonetes bacterium]|nr:TetR/AcrR family transcriptional regulator [Candidatus Cloacimonadota bacterium]
MEPKERIIKSAIKVFLKKGYDATSVNDVVEESQLSKGGIYHYFKNKQDLFIQAIDLLFTEFENIETEIYSKFTNVQNILKTYFNSLSEINKFVAEFANSDDVEIDSFYMLMMDAFVKFPEIKQRHAETQRQGLLHLISILEKAQKEGTIRKDVDCSTLGFMVSALAEGTIIYNILNERIDLEYMGQKLFDTIWNGISKE